MRYLRYRMTMMRQRKELHEMRTKDNMDRKGKGRETKTHKGAKIVEETSDDIQDKTEVVIISMDV